MEDGVDVMRSQRFINQLRVTDVTFDENEQLMGDAVERSSIPRVGQLVKDDDPISLRRKVMRQVASYKAGCSGQQIFFLFHHEYTSLPWNDTATGVIIAYYR